MSVGVLPSGAWECQCGSYNPVQTATCPTCGRSKPQLNTSQFMACDDEGKLHEEIIKRLKALSWPYVHSRMDRPTTCQWGVTDFVIAAPNGLTLWVEAKSATGKLTPEQEGFGMALLARGHKWYVVRSMDEFNAVLEKDQLNHWRL